MRRCRLSQGMLHGGMVVRVYPPTGHCAIEFCVPGHEQPPNKKRSRRVVDGYLGILRLDVEALQRGRVHGEECCEIAGLGPIPVSVARRLLSDAVLKLVLTRGVDVVNVTHLGRGPTVAQRFAKLWSSQGCAITSCAPMAGIEHDHRIDWAHTHHTSDPASSSRPRVGPGSDPGHRSPTGDGIPTSDDQGTDPPDGPEPPTGDPPPPGDPPAGSHHDGQLLAD